MPRALTFKEIMYLHALLKRNKDFNDKKKVGEISNAEYEKLIKEPLDKPQPSKERMMRMRLRQKAEQLLEDIAMIELSGIYEDSFNNEIRRLGMILMESIKEVDFEKGICPDYFISKLDKNEY